MLCLLSNTAHYLSAHKPAHLKSLSLILVRFETSIAMTYATIAVPYINKIQDIQGLILIGVAWFRKLSTTIFSTSALESVNMTFL